jgi:hypothetical protein
VSATEAASAEGETLKATAPTPQSPANGTRLADGTYSPTLVVGNAQGQYVQVAFQYRFQLFLDQATGVPASESGLVSQGSGSTTSWTVPITLQADKTYAWRARAEYEGKVGPWSATATFLSPQATDGYIRGNELYDPLINGKTVGIVHGPCTFIPGLGVKLESQESYISYELQQTLLEGEFSIIATNLAANTEGDKTKLFAMGQGYDDIVTNDRRMTVEKRGDPPGIIAWRFITHDDQVDTEGPDRTPYNFQANLTYFWEATWRNNFFNVLIKEDSTSGVNGRKVYEMGKHFDGAPYDPNPHVIYLGAPVGRSGSSGASVDHVIIRQVWVSGNPRPAFANK